MKKKPQSESIYPMVLVSWHDAKDGESGWHGIDDIKKEKLALCHSMGWMIYKDKEKTIIMADYSEFDDQKDGGRHIIIPSGWVKSIAFLDIHRMERN
jgi:hypothetical protein|tara:strand:+ start:803 stop:1093 length:291 start_codon:yes stop_codon:yes gene_type:complete